MPGVVQLPPPSSSLSVQYGGYAVTGSSSGGASGKVGAQLLSPTITWPSNAVAVTVIVSPGAATPLAGSNVTPSNSSVVQLPPPSSSLSVKTGAAGVTSTSAITSSA